MNEIITKLNEIEEKAQAILCDATATKDELALQLEQEKKKVDAKQNQIEREAMQQLEEQLRAEAKQKVTKLQEDNKRASEALDAMFSDKKEQLAEEILLRVIQ